MSRRTMKSRSFPYGTLGFAVLLLASGCAKEETYITGKVTYKTALVNSGTIYFVNDQNREWSAAVNIDGSYKRENLPIGTYRVRFDQQTVAGAAGQPPPGITLPDGGVGLPQFIRLSPEAAERYKSIQTSGLVCAVKEGKNELNLPLED